MEVLKPDLSAFNNILDFKFKANFIEFEGVSMHYIDEGSGEIILALHGQPTWSYLYRKFIPILSNYRFIALDFIGFGKSDKLIDWQAYSFDLHMRSLIHFINKLQLQKITLVVQDWGGLLGLSALGEIQQKVDRIVILNTFLPSGKSLPIPFKIWQLYTRYHPSIPISKIIQKFTFTKLDKKVLEAYDLPFPSKTHKAGPKAFPQLAPSPKNKKGITELLTARKILSEWHKPALVMFSDNDKIFSGLEHFFLKLIPYCKNQPIITIKNAGHFLQEDKGEEIANYIKMFLQGKICSNHSF